MRTWRHAIVALVVTGCAAACGGGTQTPLAPASPARGLVSEIIGYVTDAAFSPLQGVTIEVLDGPSVGRLTTSDARGQFSLAGSFDERTRFRATTQGYVAATQTWSCSVAFCGQNGARPWLDFYLTSGAPPADIAGEYSLTFIVDGTCAGFPDGLRSRTYQATIAPSSAPNRPAGTAFVLTLSGASFLGALSFVTIGVDGEAVAMSLDGRHDPTIVEQLGPTAYLAFSGDARARVAAGQQRIATQLDGWIEYCEMTAPMNSSYNCGTSNLTGEPTGAATVRATCDSSSHQLILARR